MEYQQKNPLRYYTLPFLFEFDIPYSLLQVSTYSLPLDGVGLPASGGAEGDQGLGWGWTCMSLCGLRTIVRRGG